MGKSSGFFSDDVLDPYRDVLEEPFFSGIKNGVVLYERLSAPGYHGSYGSVKKFL